VEGLTGPATVLASAASRPRGLAAPGLTSNRGRQDGIIGQQAIELDGKPRFATGSVVFVEDTLLDRPVQGAYGRQNCLLGHIDVPRVY
jgi:hypothetical protein